MPKAKAKAKAPRFPVPVLTVLPVALCDPAPWNFRGENPERQATLSESLKQNGQIQNLNVREKEDGRYEVLDGNHRIVSLQQMAVDEVVVLNHGPLTVEQGMKIAQELVEMFDVEAGRQAPVIKELVAKRGVDDLARSIPLSATRISLLASLTEFKWDGFGQKKDAPVTREEKPELIVTLANDLEQAEVELALSRIIRLSGGMNDVVGRGKALLLLLGAFERLGSAKPTE